MVVNGWRIYCFQPFRLALDELERDVSSLAARHPGSYRSHPKTKLLASVHRAVTATVPADPGHADFRLGKSLGPGHGNWRRVKKGLPARYRLFFRYSSKPIPVIVFAWLNDEDTLRKAGSKTDVYEAFRRALERGEVPDGIEALIRMSAEES